MGKTKDVRAAVEAELGFDPLVDEVADLLAEAGRLFEPGSGGGEVAGGCRRPGPGLEQFGPTSGNIGTPRASSAASVMAARSARPVMASA